MATVFKGSVNSTTNAASYATGTFATDASKVLVVIAILQDTTTNPLTISDTLGVLTWTSQLQVGIGGGSSRAAIWTAPTGAGDPSGAVTVDCTGDNATGAFVVVWQVDADTSSPVTQLKNANGAGGTTPTATFDANTQSDCILLGMVSNGNSSGTGLTEPSGYTLDVGPAGHANPTSGFHGWHHDSPGAVGSVANGGSSGSGWDIFAVEVNPAVTGQTVNYGIAAETDSALAFAHSKSVFYGIAAETDAALAFIADRRHLYGVASETDAALAFEFSKAVTYGVAIETDSGLSFMGAKLARYGIAPEVDAALALVASKLVEYGLATETDEGLAFVGSIGGGEKLAIYGIASEIDSALPLEVRTARILEGFKVGRGPMGHGVNRKKLIFATSKGRTWR